MIIDIKQAIADFYIAESHALRDHTEQIAVTVRQADQQVIQIRIFCAPAARGIHIRGECNGLLTGGQNRFLRKTDGAAVIQNSLNLRPGGGARNFSGCGQARAAVIRRKISADSQITDMHRRLCNQVHIAENTGHPPHILVFDIRAVRPLHNADR